MDNTNNIHNLVKDLQKQMDSLVKVNAKILDQIPEEHKHKVGEIQSIIDQAMTAAKTGDLDKLNLISKQHASLFNK
jgi:hypothetical protein